MRHLVLLSIPLLALISCGAQRNDNETAQRVSTSNAVVTHEPLGPSSRRTALVITEIMYKPVDRADRRNLEFVEIYNSNPWFHDVSGHRLDGDIKFTFPTNTIIPAHGLVVVAAAPADMKAQYGVSNAFGPYTGTLKASGPLRLYDEIGGLILEVGYNNDVPWPMGASGTGHSIVLARPSYGEGDPRAWQISEAVGGSPGAHETPRLSPLRNVVINEILATTDPPELSSIELYNHSNESMDLSGCVLTDDPATNKFAMPKTMIAPRGFLHFTEAQLGFKLDAAGETILFKDATGSRVLDAMRFRAQEKDVAFGRYPDGANEWHRLAKRTFGTSNASPLISDVVINEIMYHPLSRQAEDTYVELFNRGSAAVNLGGWKFVDGIEFTFSTNTVIPPNGYVVVAANVLQLLKNYPHLNRSNAIGNFTGKLSGKGEPLALSKPALLISTGAQGRVATNIVDVVVDEVTYGSGGRWGEWADGGGSSLELIDARADKRFAANWADSDETAKAKWTTIEATGLLDHGLNVIGQIAFAQIGLLEAGECLVDDIEVLRGTGGANHAANPIFDQGMANWTLLGNHSRSSLAANAGYPSTGNALHLRASSGLRPGANSATVALTTPLPEGQTATLRFKARWLKGWPEAMLRLNGNWLEATGRLPVPANLGTPGLPNSRAAANTAPAIHQVAHTPSLPAANEAVVVTARVFDPDDVNSITLRYRIDPSNTLTDARMTDDGTGGDALAGDGIFSATIPGQPANRLAAFTVAATDSRGASSRFPALLNNNAPERECLVMFGDTHSSKSFGTYHLWLTQANVARWIKLPTLSNEEIDATLVYGSRVIYNAGARYTGSPYHQAYDSPVGTACNYTWSVPKDDKFLGYSSLNTIHWPGNDIQEDTATKNNNDPTIQREQVANTFLRALGLPWVNRRYVYVYVNGRRRGTLMEDALRPSVSLHDMYFPNDKGGQIYKFQPFYEFAPLPSGNQTPFGRGSWLVFKPYLTAGGAYKKERYRWHFELRETPDSMSNYTNLIQLMNAGSAVNRPDFAATIERVADMDNWMRLVAANQAAGNWDVWGGMSGQNIYGYVSPQKRWTMFMYDMGIVLGNRIAMGPGAGLMSASADNQMWRQIYATPKFRRMYWRAMKELLNTAMLPEKSNPLMEAKFKIFTAEGLGVQSPASIEDWIAQARPRITALLTRDDAPAFTLASASVTAVNGTVTLNGVAPVEVTKITINGQPIEPAWNSVKEWTLQAPVSAGTKTLTVVAMDRFGNAVGREKSVSVAQQ